MAASMPFKCVGLAISKNLDQLRCKIDGVSIGPYTVGGAPRGPETADKGRSRRQ